MQIKKKLLIKYCILISVFVVVSIAAGVAYSNHQKEKLAEEKLEEQYQRAVDREFDSLLREYKSIVETIKDYDYSIETRRKYVKKLNELLGEVQYEYDSSNYTTVYNCIDKLDENEEEDHKILREKAAFNVLYNN